MSRPLHVNHFAEAERHLSQASWRRSSDPRSPYSDPQTASLLLAQAQVHATLAGLPEEAKAAQERLREVERELSVMRRVVADTIGEFMFDGPMAAKRIAWGLAYSLESRRVSIADAARERIEGLGGNPDALWADPDDNRPRPEGDPLMFQVDGITYDLSLPHRDRNGTQWVHHGSRDQEGLPIFATNGNAGSTGHRAGSLRYAIRAWGPLTPEPRSGPGYSDEPPF
ncbi:phiSA1p31-related protein [Streptacidiphilus carbonis]|uniref:phiSA1p31-related protein n=1 Tax=Streptacidiphilus carbonis TaxID=105422 RepID=UPI0005A62A0C|nr:phiSA1p31-related protein [Streptacidiphilus carbonis]